MFPAWILICCNVFTFRTSEKRVSSVVISSDGLYVTFADKFGVVWLVTLGENGGEQVSVDNKPLSILGHYCSIITSMVRTST
jgi:tRNA (guanine-N(7)-)-methyltransferase subunit TRM82